MMTLDNFVRCQTVIQWHNQDTPKFNLHPLLISHHFLFLLHNNMKLIKNMRNSPSFLSSGAKEAITKIAQSRNDVPLTKQL